MIGPRTSIGDRSHRVTLSGPSAPVSDGEGGWTIAPVVLTPPTWTCRIQPATVSDLERMTAGTALTRASFVISGPYRADITTETRIRFNSRTFYVNGVINVDERNVETVAFCEEQVSPTGTQPPPASAASFQSGAFQPDAFQGA
jgi:head-tail adaptor